MKKLLSVFFVCMTCFTCMMIKPARTKTFAETGFGAKSESAYLVDFNSGTIIYAKNEKERLPIASMCKIMTLLLSFEEIDAGNLSLDEEIIISENASGMGGSQVFLEANKPYKVGELIKSITVASANDASVAIAEHIKGSEEEFVAAMNNKCAELGMNDTVFANCTGLPKAGQYSCAKDVATMFSELIKHRGYFNFSNIWMDKVEHADGRYTEISNTNKLIRFYEGCDSGKTGYTSEAGHCLAASAKRKGMRLISVVIKAPDSKSRFNDVSSMFNYGFANFENRLIIDDKKPLALTVDVEKGKKDTVLAAAKEPFFLFSAKREKIALDVDFAPLERVKAPLHKGDPIGKLSIYRDNVLIKEIEVIAAEDVEKQTYFDVIKDVIDKWAI